jgi:GNAT superfamily N-acetyltransferase
MMDVNDQINRFRINLVSIEEKKMFLPLYMSYRMELLGAGGSHPPSRVKDDHLSKYWNDTNSNYLLWFMNGSERIGFTAISLDDIETGRLEDITIFRDHRGKGNGLKALEELKRFVVYRGLKNLYIKTDSIPESAVDFFNKGGFKTLEERMFLEL